jgi:ATP-binding cassette subfamily F protein 3
MLALRDVRLRRGPRVLVEHADLVVHAGEKLGIVGRNGSGKSSLLALVRGELAPDAGDYQAPARLTISSVAQEVPHSAERIVDFVRAGDAELLALEHAIAAAHAAGDGHREALLHAEHDAAGGYTATSRAARLAVGLGFAADEIERPLAEFSGGLRMRASLARALMRRADLLLLDEPTNHLDLDAVLWLESWLRAYAGTLLVVSHDREFLDAIVGRIVHLAGARLEVYTGNYSSFEAQHAAAAAQTAAAAAAQRREAARIEAFVERFRAKASKARQVQSRLKWLARLPQVVEAQGEQTFEWAFERPARLPRPLVTLEHVAAGYAARRVLEDVRLAVAPGDRLGVLGRNGAGKSTLMRTLAGALDPLAGTRVAAPDLEVGVFAQLEVEQLDVGATPIEELARRGGEACARWRPQELRDHLGQFGFRGDRVFEPIAGFSGGERARLTLAILVARRPNLLLLDEPTNHLDFEMRHALLVALQDYAGAVVLVSHDRALLRGVCDELLLVRDGRVAPFDGDLEDYAAALAASARGGGSATASPRRERRRLEAELRQRVAPLRSELRALERSLAALGERRRVLEAQMGDPAYFAGPDRDARRESATVHRALLEDIDRHETQWLEVSERLGQVEKERADLVDPPERGSLVRKDA